MWWLRAAVHACGGVSFLPSVFCRQALAIRRKNVKSVINFMSFSDSPIAQILRQNKVYKTLLPAVVPTYDRADMVDMTADIEGLIDLVFSPFSLACFSNSDRAKRETSKPATSNFLAAAACLLVQHGFLLCLAFPFTARLVP